MGDPPAVAEEQRRQEAVHVLEIRKLQERLAAEGLDAAGGVTGRILEKRAAEPVGNARADLLGERGFAADPLSGDETDPRILEMTEEIGDEARIVLAVAVEGDDQRRARRDHA